MINQYTSIDPIIESQMQQLIRISLIKKLQVMTNISQCHRHVLRTMGKYFH